MSDPFPPGRGEEGGSGAGGGGSSGGRNCGLRESDTGLLSTDIALTSSGMRGAAL
jgi:hypothetical protein